MFEGIVERLLKVGGRICSIVMRSLFSVCVCVCVCVCVILIRLPVCAGLRMTLSHTTRSRSGGFLRISETLKSRYGAGISTSTT